MTPDPSNLRRTLLDPRATYTHHHIACPIDTTFLILHRDAIAARHASTSIYRRMRIAGRRAEVLPGGVS